MTDYISREAALDAISEWLMKALHPENMSSYSDGERAAYRTALSEIADLPAADARPVVLCRDCEYSYDSVGGWCCSHGICVDCIVREDFFCADGEKREES